MKKHSLKKAAALKYNPKTKKAPLIVASAQGKLAEKIIALAEENKIPLQKNTPLVEALVTLEIGQEIPPDLYETVALLLTYIMEADELMGDSPASSAKK